MRPASTLELKVGMLIVGGLIATVALVLVTDRISFDRYYQVNAYLADAAGLRPNSPVTLSGIRIGEVENLIPVNDPRGNILVRIKVNQRHLIPADATLTISSSGIFGDSYLAFTGSSDVNTRTLGMDGKAEVKASRGFFDKASQQAENILAGASDLLGGETSHDIKRLVKNAADLAAAGVRLADGLEVQGKELGATLASVRALSDELRATTRTLGERAQSTMQHVEGALATIEKQGDALGARAGATLDRIDALAEHGGKAVDGTASEVASTLAGMRTLSERLNRIATALDNGEGVAGQLLRNRELARELNNTAIDLSRTAAYVADHPEALVFGASKEDAAAQRARREREKERRAFHEGFGGIPLQVAPPAAAAP
jgi:phospholipid/cholesterol/gamma-HCH transport system substrate-binding protein